MGITDEVIIELYCPYCGEKLLNKSFQTKDLNPSMDKYTVVQALIENQRQGGGYLRLFFNCKNCDKCGHLDISDYNWEMEKEIKEVLEDEKRILDVIENKWTEKLRGKNG